jgi:transcription antitermination factor NusG
MNQAWFALRVKSNRERVTAASLAGRGYDVFLPEYRRPLFPGYLFCRFDINDRFPVVSVPGIVHIVGLGKQPVPVDEAELDSLRIVVQAGLPVRPEAEYAVGQQIRIDRGPLAGASGIVTGLGPQYLLVTISLLQRSVSVALERDWISPNAAPAEIRLDKAQSAAVKRNTY